MTELGYMNILGVFLSITKRKALPEIVTLVA